MEEFKKAISNLEQEFEGSPDMGDPQEFFEQMTERLNNRFDIFRKFDQFDAVKSELLAALKTSKLEDHTREILIDQVQRIPGYTKLLMYLSQQVEGL